MPPAVEVSHNVAAHRFEAHVQGLLCRVDYHMMGGVMAIHHTEVPRPLEGRGIAAQLVRAALAHARTHGLKVAPYCSYVGAYMRRHPETQDLVAAR